MDGKHLCEEEALAVSCWGSGRSRGVLVMAQMGSVAFCSVLWQRSEAQDRNMRGPLARLRLALVCICGQGRCQARSE